MKARRLRIGAAAAGLTAVVLFLGGALHGSPRASSAAVAQPPAADDTATQIAKLQGELRASRDDVALARRARARLPAAGARDGRPDLLHEV